MTNAQESAHGVNDLTADEKLKLETWFKYHNDPLKVVHYEAINEAARNLAATVMQHTPRCADQSAALRLIRDARMTANAAIACEGV